MTYSQFYPSDLTDRLYELKLTSEDARREGVRLYNHGLYERARTEFGRMKDAIWKLSGRYTIGRDDIAFADRYIRLCDEKIGVTATAAGRETKKAADEKILKEIFNNAYSAATSYGYDEVHINIHSDVLNRLPKETRRKVKHIRRIIEKESMPLEQDDTWPDIFNTKVSDLTRYGKKRGFL